MRLPIVQDYSALPGGSVAAAQQVTNALLQQQYQNQISRAQAQNAPMNQQGIAMQNFGYGQNALQIGANAPMAQLGNALQQYGTGQQEAAMGQLGVPLAQATLSQQQQAAAQAGISTQEMQILLKRFPNMTDAQMISMMAEAKSNQAYANAAPSQAAADVVNTLTPAFSVATANPKTALASLPFSSPYFEEFRNALNNLPSLSSNSSQNNSGMGTINLNGTHYNYQGTRIVNGQTQYWIPSVNKWAL